MKGGRHKYIDSITGIGDGGRDRNIGGYRAYMEIRREQAKISDYCGFDSRIPHL